jgi:drug/metabolite transporter (DMT)-like permease
VSWPVGLLLAFASACATNVGFLMRQRGATAAPAVDVRRPLRTAAGLFRERWWSLGFGVAFIAWALQVGALKLAPLSLVQAVLASGFVCLGVLAERVFGFDLRRREWTGIGLTAVGVAFLALTAAASEQGGEHSRFELATMAAFEAALIVAGASLIVSHGVSALRDRRGPLLGAGAGLLFTVTHVAIKGLTGTVDLARPMTLVNGWLALCVVAAVAAFFASARSLQVGDAVPVIAVTSVASNISAILAGIVVFNDPLGSNELLVTLRIAAFALVVVAAALMPAPMRAAAAEPA